MREIHHIVRVIFMKELCLVIIFVSATLATRPGYRPRKYYHLHPVFQHLMLRVIAIAVWPKFATTSLMRFSAIFSTIAAVCVVPRE
ncbi:hypothetical protein V1506DRAFT_528292 [Lipomyces tetrasporus]